MLSRLIGAVVRSILVVILIATPALLIPGVSADAKQIVALVAIFGAALTIFEYASTYPGLIEFRDAPPYNRFRFLSLFATVFLLSLTCRHVLDPALSTQSIYDFAAMAGRLLDFPYSPVRLVILMMPPDSTFEHLDTVRMVAGVSYGVGVLTVAVFYLYINALDWPFTARRFNVWVNLPTFDPTSGGDVVFRMYRDASLNMRLGFLLPFLVPALVKLWAFLFEPISLENHQNLVWAISAWAFLPASLFMRGLALARIAEMIEEKRRVYSEPESDEDYSSYRF